MHRLFNKPVSGDLVTWSSLQARHSEVFRDMLEFPQPESKLESYEGCQVVCMYDTPLELSHLVKALYDGP